MLRRLIRSSLLASSALVVLQPDALAQKVSFSPTIGVYVPTTELINAANGQKFKQEIGLSLGARLGLLFGQRFSISVTGNYVPSNLHVTFANDSIAKSKVNLWFGSGRAGFFLIPPTKPIYAQINGGVALVGRGADPDQGTKSTNDIGGVVGALVGVRLGSVLSIYVAADDYIYHPKVFANAGTTGGTGETTLKSQNDIHLSLGFGIPLNR